MTDAAYQRKYMASHPDQRKKAVAYVRKRAEKNRIWINRYKSERGCSMCAENDFRCLDFHHLDPKEKAATVSKMYGYAAETIMKEILKCVLLCANCHRKMTERPFIGRIGDS